MNLFELTRTLVDIESITGNEARVGNFLFNTLAGLAARHNGRVERMDVEPERFNVLAWWGERPAVTLSTHMDTVPPFFPSGDDGEYLTGRASCDTKGIIACMVKAAEALLEERVDARRDRRRRPRRSGGDGPSGAARRRFDERQARFLDPGAAGKLVEPARGLGPQPVQALGEARGRRER